MLLNRGKPVEEMVEDERVDPALREMLRRIPEIRAFGERNGLKPTPNYREYVELPGDSVVHVVTVSEALKFKPEVFSFPLVGSFTYIGWFDRKDAEDFASAYRQRGLDVDIRGASAYSTLGWFRDPLLSSMIPKTAEGRIQMDSFPELVHVFLHESVHATLYFKGQSYFNESLADFVADVLTERFFFEGGVASRTLWERYRDRQRRVGKTRELLTVAYQKLEALYGSDSGEAEKRSEKAKILQRFGIDTGISRDLNNASLIQFKTYDPGDRGFQQLLDRYRGEIPAFLSRLSRLKDGDFGSSQREDIRGLLDSIRD